MGLTSRAERRSARRIAAMRPEIELQIGEVVLLGFEPGDRTPIGDAMGARLGELLGAGAVPSELAGDSHQDWLRAREVGVPEGASRGHVGRSIAEAVAAGLGVEAPDRNR